MAAACDLAALRVLWKASIQSPRWLDFVPLNEAVFKWQEMIPEASSVLQSLHWDVNPQASEFRRRDGAGRLRVLRPCFDGFQVLFQWLRQHFRQSYVARSGRVKQRLHRDGEELATGLDLPRPDFTLDCHFDGLREALSVLGFPAGFTFTMQEATSRKSQVAVSVRRSSAFPSSPSLEVPLYRSLKDWTAASCGQVCS